MKNYKMNRSDYLNRPMISCTDPNFELDISRRVHLNPRITFPIHIMFEMQVSRQGCNYITNKTSRRTTEEEMETLQSHRSRRN